LPSLYGQDVRWESVGVRFGFNPDGAAEDFYQASVCANWLLPWDWRLDSVWHLQTGLDASAGALGQGGREAAMFSAGPTLTLKRDKLPLSLALGVSPTVLTRTEFVSKDLGFPFQFASSGGLNLDLGAHIRLTYRFQHMSNGHIATPNPGLNLHVLGVSYVF
jgi:hypothetical protein